MTGLTRGAGPRTTLPSLLYCDPWQGHLNLLSVLLHGTTQPAADLHARVLLSLVKAQVDVKHYMGMKTRAPWRENPSSLCRLT